MSAITTATMLDAALSYARRGWPVFPLHTPTADGYCNCGNPGCRDIGKHPSTTHGHLDATTNEAMIRRWWTQFPDANIGTPTSSQRFAVDAEAGTGQDTLEAWQAEHGLLPPTAPLVATGGGGVHVYFATPEGMTIRCSTETVATGIDIRGEGGYTVLPPSLHASGQRYRWLDPITEPPLAPGWLVDRILAASRRLSDRVTGDAGAPIPKGRRNTTLAAIAGRMRWTGLTPDELYDVLLRVNQERCQPPLAGTEIAKIARSIGRYPVGDVVPGPGDAPPGAVTTAASDRWADRGAAQDPRIAELQALLAQRDARITTLETQVVTLREVQPRQARILANRALGPQRVVTAALATQFAWRATAGETPPSEVRQPPPPGMMRLPVSEVARVAGVSVKTAGSHLKWLAERGEIQRKIVRRLESVDPETGEFFSKPRYISVHYVGPTGVTELTPEAAVAFAVRGATLTTEHIERRGGKRPPAPCPDHPKAEIIQRVSFHCGECDRKLDRLPDTCVTPAPDRPANFADHIGEVVETYRRPKIGNQATPRSAKFAHQSPVEPIWLADAPDVSDEDAEPGQDASIQADLNGIHFVLSTSSSAGAPLASTGSALADGGRDLAEIPRDRGRTPVSEPARLNEDLDPWADPPTQAGDAPDSWHVVPLLAGSAARSPHWQTEPPPGVPP
jgi:hypothetical protein